MNNIESIRDNLLPLLSNPKNFLGGEEKVNYSSSNGLIFINEGKRYGMAVIMGVTMKLPDV